jgi:hypothetical protein
MENQTTIPKTPPPRKVILSVRQVVKMAKGVGIEDAKAIRLGDEIFIRMAEQQSTDPKLSLWWLPRKDGKLVQLRTNLWAPVVRAIMRAPHDGHWYLLDQTGILSGEQRKRAVFAARQWLSRAGYTRKDVSIYGAHKAGLMIRWKMTKQEVLT